MPALRAGLVSDSHGLHDPGLDRLLAGCEVVLHAGDVVKPAVLEALRRLAPVRAVRGNNDVAPPLASLPEALVEEVGGLPVLVVHDLGARAAPHPSVRRLLVRHRPAVVVHGHSHRPGAEVIDGRLFVNPGSCGPRRFSLPRTAAMLEVSGRRVRIDWYDLAGAGRPAAFGAPLEVEL
ncbi:MAG: metallophosphoesterase family protein [Anaeromyxobacter sp.]